MEHKISNELPPLPTEEATPNMPPSAEYQSQDLTNEKQGAQAIETGAPQSNPFLQQVAQNVPNQQPDQPVAQPLADPQSPIIADDTDLIEKEWVIKAKEIVARTRNDPFQQNKEVERIKADYMKKRYNKDVKITEE